MIGVVTTIGAACAIGVFITLNKIIAKHKDGALDLLEADKNTLYLGMSLFLRTGRQHNKPSAPDDEGAAEAEWERRERRTARRKGGKAQRRATRGPRLKLTICTSN